MQWKGEVGIKTNYLRDIPFTTFKRKLKQPNSPTNRLLIPFVTFNTSKPKLTFLSFLNGKFLEDGFSAAFFPMVGSGNPNLPHTCLYSTFCKAQL